MPDGLVGLFDMDGTLFNHDAAVLRDLNKIRSPQEEEYTSIPHGDDKPEWLEQRIRLVRSQPGWWRNLEKYQPGWDVYEIAVKLGFCIEILTKGPRSNPQAWAEKVECIMKHFDEDVVPNIVGKTKKRYHGRFLVDDYPVYCEDWLNRRPRGLVIMPAHDYNANFAHPRAIRYDGTNLNQIRKALEIVKARKDGEPLDLSYL